MDYNAGVWKKKKNTEWFAKASILSLHKILSCLQEFLKGVKDVLTSGRNNFWNKSNKPWFNSSL